MTIPVPRFVIAITAVFAASRRDDHRSGSIVEQPRQADGPADVVQPQLDQLDPLFNKVLVLGDHSLVAGTP